MATSGGQLGNKNAAKSKVWTLAIERALEARSKVAQVNALDALAERLLLACDAGDMTALKELGDRLEGKPALALTGPDGGAIEFTTVVRKIIK